MGIIRDISDLKQAENALRESEQRFRDVTEAAGEYIWEIDANAIYTYITEKSKQVKGYTPAQLLGRSPTEFMPPEDIESVGIILAEASARKESFTLKHRNILPTGEVVWEEVTGVPVLDNCGEIIGFRGTGLNITHRKQAEAAVLQKSQELEQTIDELKQAQLQMVQNEKMATLGNLVAGVAHEINNPIGFITGSVNNIEEYIQDLIAHLEYYQKYYPEPVPEVSDHAEDIDLEFLMEDLPKLIPSMKIASQRIREISNSLRTFSRADTAEKVACDIHEGINSTLLILKYRLKASPKRPAIKVITEYGKLPLVKCFLGQLNQVFMNIIANAIDALDAACVGRTFAEIETNPQLITICTEVSGDRQMAVIRIKDNGPGMSEEVQAYIFDHLFTTKEVGQGTGLGLAKIGRAHV